MPEGDSLHSLAVQMGPRLEGQRTSEVRLREHGAIESLRGQPIRRVEARGKNLLIHFTGGATIRVHLGMKGRIRRRDPQGFRPPLSANLTLCTSRDAYVCTGAAIVELLRDRDLRRHRSLSRLGPDLLHPQLDLDTVLARVRDPAHARRSIAEVLLDQRIAAGIGNVYRSEVLFMERVSPFLRVEDLDDDTLRRLYTCAAAQLRANVGPGARMTQPKDPLRRGSPRPRDRRLWVYRRSGRPCLHCGTPIEMRRMGDQARSTYFCPRCQAKPTPAGGPHTEGTAKTSESRSP